jgi:hypothetical protein
VQHLKRKEQHSAISLLDWGSITKKNEIRLCIPITVSKTPKSNMKGEKRRKAYIMAQVIDQGKYISLLVSQVIFSKSRL